MPWTERVGLRLTPRDLHLFLVVAEEGSMAKAADRLAVSRPVVSKAIAGLEALLGARLLDRGRGGVVPTPYGRVLLRRGLAVFDELRHGVEEVAALADPNAGLLRIGCTEVNAAGIVAAAVERLSRRFPRMRFEVRQGNVMSRMHLLRERGCDLFVSRPMQSEPEPEDMAFEPLLHERLLVVCGARAPWARRRRVTLAELAGEHWILGAVESAPDGPVWEAFRAAGLALPRTRTISDSLALRHGLLETGRFLTLIPHTVLRLAPRWAEAKVLPVDIPPWRWPTVVATLKDRTLTPLAGLFVEQARAVAAELGEGRIG